MSSLILVTGASGKLGVAVCRALLDAGFRVRATDRRFEPDLPTRVELGDLCDELFVYRLVEGVDAVVHLGNHPNQFAGPSAQTLLAENTAMNANVFYAARDLGVRTIVFASSVQVMIRREKGPMAPPYGIPYLPLDGALPANPGTNTYAQSKEFAERMLRLLVEADPRTSATSLRFPMLVTEAIERRFRTARRIPMAGIDFVECTAHLFLADAGRLVVRALERRAAGYRQYFPATAMDISGISLEELLTERYPDVRRTKPLADFVDLIDTSAITADLGWAPEQRLRVEIER